MVGSPLESSSVRKKENNGENSHKACMEPLVVVVLPLFIDIWYEVFFIKTLIIMPISTNIHRPYACDPLGLYMSLVNNSIDEITPYWSTLINYPHPHIY